MGLIGVIVAAVIGAAFAKDELVSNDGPGKGANRNSEATYSLRAPFKPEDNTHWSVGGHAGIVGSVVNLAPSKPNQKGFLWSRVPNSRMIDWEVVLELSISGSGRAGQGMAFWYTETAQLVGTVYGGSDNWNGLGISVSTNPRTQKEEITAMFNDGSLSYANMNAGTGRLGQCTTTVRGLEEGSFFLRVTYNDHKLDLEYANYRDGDSLTFEHCMSYNHLHLGMDKFFGVTGATRMGEQPSAVNEYDSHDVLRIQTTDLSGEPPEEVVRERRQEVEEEAPGHEEQEQSQDRFTHITAARLHRMTHLLTEMETRQMQNERIILANDIINHQSHEDKLLGMAEAGGVMSLFKEVRKAKENQLSLENLLSAADAASNRANGGHRQAVADAREMLDAHYELYQAFGGATRGSGLGEAGRGSGLQPATRDHLKTQAASTAASLITKTKSLLAEADQLERDLDSLIIRMKQQQTDSPAPSAGGVSYWGHLALLGMCAALGWAVVTQASK